MLHFVFIIPKYSIKCYNKFHKNIRKDIIKHEYSDKIRL